jgi:diguanylate cyclase (GGDEF)-like protein
MERRPGWHALLAAIATGFVGMGAVVALIAASGLRSGSPFLNSALVVVGLASMMLLVLVPLRHEVMRRQDLALTRQAAILGGAAIAAERLLLRDDIDEALKEVLARLGHATDVSRAYVYRNHRDVEGALLMSIEQEWLARGVPPTSADPENLGYPYDEGFGHWVEQLSQGQPIQLVRSASSGMELQDMDETGTRSAVMVPVFVESAWWGFLGFDDCRRERHWSASELDALKVAAGMLGASLSRTRAMRTATDAQARVAHLAFHDTLTGLPNQELFTQVTEMALARARRSDLAVAVLFLDVDSFKLANDSLGIEGGDRLLVEIGERLATSIRETDTLARRAGDEFLILLADLDRGEVGEMQAPILFGETAAARIREALSEPFAIAGHELYVSVSMGISVCPDDAADVGELLQHAETAMLRSKELGPGGFAASTVGAVDSATKLAFVTRLRRAVERKEWTLHYQPMVELATGSIKGVEALIRWRAGEELIQPNEFIPLAEELGLIEEMGDWVVEELVRQDHAWRAEGIDLEVGFNLSPRQFWQADLAERIISRLAERETDPTNIMVEITESSAMRDPERAQKVLWALHLRGLRLAIDDFGTGYSSLSRLRHLPIDVLKIDRSFVSGVDTDAQSARIVSAFIQLGRGLGMTTLAEGIETEGEWRFLAEQGCELGQGFYFSRPVPAEEITRRWRAGATVTALPA